MDRGYGRGYLDVMVHSLQDNAAERRCAVYGVVVTEVDTVEKYAMLNQ